MATVEDNLNHWNNPANWSAAGHEWSGPWGTTLDLWEKSLFPRIRGYVPTGTILEIAPGHGRVTEFLLPLCKRYVGVDLAPSCVRICQERFADRKNAVFHTNDGRTLPMVKTGSIDFVISFDSLVHVEADAMESYVREIARVLRPGAVAFLHHSNLGAYAQELKQMRSLAATGKVVPFGAKALARLGLTGWDNFRAPSMSADKMMAFAREAGLDCHQERVNWVGTRLIDCMTTLRKTGNQPPISQSVDNPRFGDEGKGGPSRA